MQFLFIKIIKAVMLLKIINNILVEIIIFPIIYIYSNVTL